MTVSSLGQIDGSDLKETNGQHGSVFVFSYWRNTYRLQIDISAGKSECV